MKTKVAFFLVIALTFFLQTAAFSSVRIGMEMNPNPVQPGQALNIILTVANEDAAAGTGELTLALVYPSNMNTVYTSEITTGGASNRVTTLSGKSYCISGDQLLWTLGSLPPGGGVSVTLPPDVSNGIEDGTLIQFDAKVLVDDVQQAEISKTLQVESDPFFELNIDEATDPVTTDGLLAYVCTYGNISSKASNVKLAFPIPTGTSFVSATGGGTESAGEVTWDLGSLASGEGGRQKVIVQVNASEGNLLEVMDASLSGMDSGFISHESLAGCITRVEDSDLPNLAIDIDSIPVQPGEQLDVELTVSNPGNETLSNVELYLSYPSGMGTLYTSEISTGGDANTVTTWSGKHYCLSGDLVLWSLGNLPPGVGVSVTLPPDVSNDTADGALIQFEAQVYVDGVQKIKKSKTTQIQSDPFFELTIDEATDPVITDGFLKYVLTYGNTSSNASNVQLVFPLPAGTSFLSATGGGTESAGEVTWDLGSLSSGEGGQQQVFVQVNASEGDLLEVMDASLSGMDAGFIFHEVFTGRITRVRDADLPNLAIDVNSIPVQASEQLDIELTVSNLGSDTLSNVALYLSYPSHMGTLYTSEITTGGDANTVTTWSGNTYCVSGDRLVWSLGNLPPGVGVTVTLPPDVSGDTADGTLVQFEAQVSVDGVQQTAISKTAFVGSNFNIPSFIEGSDPQYLVLSDDTPITLTSGSFNYVYGCHGANNISIESGTIASLIHFPGSNTITVQSNSSLFIVSRSGATVTFEGFDGTILVIPVTVTAQSIVFNDKNFELKIDSGAVMLGSQIVLKEGSALD